MGQILLRNCLLRNSGSDSRGYPVAVTVGQILGNVDGFSVAGVGTWGGGAGAASPDNWDGDAFWGIWAIDTPRFAIEVEGTHAQSRITAVSVETSAGTVTLTVADDLSGFAQSGGRTIWQFDTAFQLWTDADHGIDRLVVLNP